MKVKELIELLRESDQEDRVLIAVEKKNNRFGQSSGVGIVHLYNGFDWDEGNVYIIGNLDLEVSNPQKDTSANK